MKVRAFIDNDKTRLGYLYEIKVIAPDCISAVEDEGTYIWIATGAEEVYEQARKITDQVLEWKFVEMILESQTERPTYPQIPLQNHNLKIVSY